MGDEYTESIKIEEAITLKQCIQRIDYKIESFNGCLQQEGGGLTRPIERGYRDNPIERYKRNAVKSTKSIYCGGQ